MSALSRMSRGLCGAAALAGLAVVPAAAMTSHAGWPADQHLVMEQGPAGQHHVLRGWRSVHNYLLGGYGNDTIYGGGAGDVIWGDYRPAGTPRWQEVYIYAGDGPNYIYANDTVDHVWTGTGRTIVHAHFGSGEIHCQSPQVLVYLSHKSRPRYRLFGCRHISYLTLGY
jgi:hypothetical protein